MACGESGKIVIEVEPELKKRLYAALALSGSTLKDWLCKTAVDYCQDTAQPSLFGKLDPVPRTKTDVPALTAAATNDSNKTPGV